MQYDVFILIRFVSEVYDILYVHIKITFGLLMIINHRSYELYINRERRIGEI
jgi:hypothetical protein